jgi:ribose transport system substrate-binding protein
MTGYHVTKSRFTVLAIASAIGLPVCRSGDPSPPSPDAGPPASGALAVAQTPVDPVVVEAKAAITKATVKATTWDGPTTGPKAPAGKLIVFMSADQRNGGAAAVSQGVAEAAKAMGWELRILDGQGTATATSAGLGQAIALKPAGIIIGGIDAKEQKDAIARAAAQGIKVVGWHAAPGATPLDDPPLFANITTDAKAVAKLAADYVIATSDGTAGVVIFTDSVHAIAIEKSETMRDAIKRCARCKVLSYEDSPLSEASTRMPQLTTSLLQRFGKAWTHALGINDLYFDFGAPALRSAGVPPSGQPHFISAGDGSESAYERIKNGRYQVATVAEPLNLQGWQAADELNRAVAGEPWSGYVPAMRLVTKDDFAGNEKLGASYDPPNGYREAYKKIWSGQ